MFKRVLHVRRVARTTMRGKIRSTHVMAVVGNGRGSAGLGESTASDPRTAVERAIENAQKNMHYFERFENRTVPCEMERTHHKTHVRLDPARPGKPTLPLTENRLWNLWE
jgi:ribosomal protein S5